ncbi:MAG: 5-formyltetrahydrofolate cyclo-ligase [Pseudomonadota bacterium]
MTDLTTAKADARKAAFARRKAAHLAFRDKGSEALVRHLTGSTGRVIAGYLPIRTEADPVPAMEALAPKNTLCVPVVEGPGRPLSFRAWEPGVPLVEGAFGVMVPASGATLIPELVIVPMVAFDPALFRLGYGGGFYDRTLAGLRAAGPVTALGFAYSEQEAPSLPLEPTDQPLDLLVTEAGVRSRL